MASNAAATGFAALAAAAVFGAVVVGVGEHSVVAVMVAAVPAVLAFWLVNNLLVAVALRLSQGGSLPQRFRTLVTSETSILVFALLGALCGYAYRELGAWPGTLMLATVLGIADGMLMPRAPRLRSVDRQDEVRRDDRQWVAAVVAVVGVGALVLVHASTGRLPGGAELGVLTGAAFLATAVLARLDDLLARSAVVLAAVATLVVCRSDGPVLATALVAAAGVAGIAVTAGERPVALVVAAGRGAVLGGLTGVAAVVVTAGRIGTPFGLVTAGLVGGVVWAVAVAGPVLRRLRVVSGRLDGALVAGVLLAECDLLLAGLVGAVVGRLAVVGHSTAAGMVAAVVLAGAALLARSRETQPVRCEQPDERVLVGLQEALLDQRGLVPVDADE